MGIILWTNKATNCQKLENVENCEMSEITQNVKIYKREYKATPENYELAPLGCKASLSILLNSPLSLIR